MDIIELKKLITEDGFDEALGNGAERQEYITGVLKKQHKANFDTLFDVFVRSRPDIQEILDKKAKQRTAADKDALKAFKKEMSAKFRLVKGLLFIPDADRLDENGIERKLSKKLVRLVEQISAVVQLLDYIGHSELEDELKRRGISLKYCKLRDEHEVFDNERVEETVKGVFESALGTEKAIDDGKNVISVDIFENEVAPELRYDKEMNPVGIKPSDFKKLVVLKHKELQVLTEEARAKVNDAVTKASSEKTFEMARAEVVREKVMTMKLDPPSEKEEEGDM